MKVVIMDGDAKQFQIQPEDIDVIKHLWNAFGDMETEISARWIIRFLQLQKQGWIPFSYDELNSFYRWRLGQNINFSFNRLLDQGYIVECSDNKKYRITTGFVRRCYESSPTKA